MEENNFKTQYDEHGERLLNEIFSWFVNKTLPDVILHVEDQPIEAHKLVLGASSTFFKSIFCTRERKDLYFEDISYRTMKAIVEYMYTGELIVEWGLMPECLKLADCLMIRGLSKLYGDKVVSEPAPVSQEMLDAIESISQSRSCALIQQNDYGDVSESMEEAWQKQSNLPKLQLKRDAKTGNWIPKMDDLTKDHNGNTRVKPTTKLKSNEPGTKEAKITNIYIQNENFEDFSKENMNSNCDTNLCKQELKNGAHPAHTLPSPIKEHERSARTAFSNGADSAHQFYKTENEPSINYQPDLKSLPNSNFSSEQDFEMASQESNFNAAEYTSFKNNDNNLIATIQPLKAKNAPTTLLAPIPQNVNQRCKKRVAEQNGKLTASCKSSKKSTVPGKRAPDAANKMKASAKTSKTAEQKTSTLRRNKKKQKCNVTASSTASKATDLLIKNLFFERNIKRSPESAQQLDSKSPKQSALSTPNTNIPTLNTFSQSTEELESGKAIKAEPIEATTTGTKPLYRLAGRCKVSDWHIDESEVLECDEEYEQHKNAPCPQPAEFLKTEKLVYGCPSCNKAYTLKSNYRRHYVVTHRRQDMPVYKCPICDSRFTRTDNRNSHIRKIHDFADPLAVQAWNQPFYMCALCKKGFYNDNDLQNHLKTVHPPSRNSYCGRIV